MLKVIQSAINRVFRNDLNANFEYLDSQRQRLEAEITTLESRLDNILSAVTINSEVQDARVDATGTTYASLNARLNTKDDYRWDTGLNQWIKIEYVNGATNTKKKVNNVWVDI